MSRTFKDRPYWVRENDPKEERKIIHNHYWFGKELSVSRNAKDENGNEIKEHYYFVHKLYGAERVNIKNPSEAPEGVHVFTRNKKEIYEKYTVPDVCEIRPSVSHLEEKTHPENRVYCGHSLRYDNYNRPHKSERADFHRKARTNENRALRKITRMWDDDELSDEYDGMEILTARTTRYKGWWD